MEEPRYRPVRSLVVLAWFLIVTGSADAQPVCLDIADATSTSFTSERTMLVKTRDYDLYRVTFRFPCSAAMFPRTHFVYERWTLQPCLRGGQALATNDKGPCVIDSVTRLAGGK